MGAWLCVQIFQMVRKIINLLKKPNLNEAFSRIVVVATSEWKRIRGSGPREREGRAKWVIGHLSSKRPHLS